MTEIYKNGKAKKTESGESKNKESGCMPDGIWVRQKKICQASQSNTCTNIAIRSREDDCIVVNSYRFFFVYYN